MAEANGIVKHIVIGKFKDDITQQRIDELIKGYANLVNLVPTMKSFHWYIFFSKFMFPFFRFCIDLQNQWNINWIGFQRMKIAGLLDLDLGNSNNCDTVCVL